MFPDNIRIEKSQISLGISQPDEPDMDINYSLRKKNKQLCIVLLIKRRKCSSGYLSLDFEIIKCR